MEREKTGEEIEQILKSVPEKVRDEVRRLLEDENTPNSQVQTGFTDGDYLMKTIKEEGLEINIPKEDNPC